MIFADENNDKIKLIILFPEEIDLDNNKTILNICDNSRNQVLKKNNLSKKKKLINIKMIPNIIGKRYHIPGRFAPLVIYKTDKLAIDAGNSPI